jgi:OmcA/MtrC family decaheme c-type cytochrome
VLAFRRENMGRLATIVAAMLLVSGLGGCSGSGGPPPEAPGSGTGPTGPGGGSGSPGNGPVVNIAAADYVVPAITSVALASAPVIEFQLQDRSGSTLYRGATLSGNGMRFVLSQLAPPDSGGKSTIWARLAYERAAASGSNLGTLIDHGDGTYTYSFSTDVTADARYEASQTTRIGLELSVPEADNGLYTWRPADGATADIPSREIVSTKTCNSCHDDLEGHANRRETQYCVLCHAPELGGGAAYFPYMIHQIHAGKGPWGQGIVFPQPLSNCETCHDASDPDAPQAGNWETVPNAAACGSCHDNVNFETGENHAAGPSGDEHCIDCHGPDATLADGRLRVARAHENRQLKFSSRFRLEIVAVEGVLEDGSPGTVEGRVSPGEYAKVTIRVSNPESGQAYDILDPAGPFAGLPGATSTRLRALVNWSNQDYSNYRSEALDRDGNLSPGTATTIDFLGDGVTDNGDGTFTKGSNAPVPAEKITGSGTVFLVARPAMQVDTERLTGDPVNDYVYVDAAGSAFAITDETVQERRTVVDFDNCNDCHGKVAYAGHGSTYAANNEAGFVCLSCHGPDRACPQFAADGTPIPAPGLLDMKYMIHAIHAGTYDSCGNDLTGLTRYPGKLNNCEGCHAEDTFYPVAQTEVLASTLLNGADIANPELDINVSPNKTACVGCHTESPDLVHMWDRGSSFNELADVAGWPVVQLVEQVDGTLISGNVETCGDCHGKGAPYDIRVLHGVDNFRFNR